MYERYAISIIRATSRSVECLKLVRNLLNLIKELLNICSVSVPGLENSKSQICMHQQNHSCTDPRELIDTEMAEQEKISVKKIPSNIQFFDNVSA